LSLTKCEEDGIHTWKKKKNSRKKKINNKRKNDTKRGGKEAKD